MPADVEPPAGWSAAPSAAGAGGQGTGPSTSQGHAASGVGTGGAYGTTGAGGWFGPSTPGGRPALEELLGARGATIAGSLARGNWAGALRCVLTGLALMFALTLIGLLLVGAAAGGPRVLAFGADGVALAVGGSVHVDGGGGSVGIRAFPLTVTLAGFGVMAWLFLRDVRGLGIRAVAEQAARVALLLLASLLAICLLAQPRFGTADGTTIKVRPGIADTLIFGLLCLAVSLAVAVGLRRADLLGGRLRAVRGRLIGPLAGALLVPAGLLPFALIIPFGVAAAHGNAAVGLGGALLGFVNIAGFGAALGLGVPFTADLGGGIGGLDIGGTYSTYSGSLTVAQLGEANAWFWLLPVAAAGLLLAGAVAVALRAPTVAHARRDALTLAVALPVMLVVDALVVSVHLTGQGYFGLFTVNGSAHAHPNYLLAVVLGGLWGGLAGGLGFLAASRVSAQTAAVVRRGLGRLRLAWDDPAGAAYTPDPQASPEAQSG